MEIIENKTYDEIQVGDKASLSRVLTMEDIQLFAVMSGDVNPAHLDEQYARGTRFREIIAHGMWGGALISTVIGTQLPGAGSIYMDQSLRFKKPVGLGETVTVTVTVKEKKDKNRIILDCVCADQDNDVVISGEALVMAPTEKVRREKIDLPEFVLRDSEGQQQVSEGFKAMMDQTKDMSPLVAGVVHPVNALSLQGVAESVEAGLLEPILIGPEHRVKAAAEEGGVDISQYDFIPTEHSHASADLAVHMAREGKVEALMKGKLHTQELMSAVVGVGGGGGLRTGRRMSHVFALDVPNYHKPLFLTDAAINVYPNLAEKTDIVQNAIDLFIALTNKSPKVAIVSAVETVDEKIQSTLDATALCKMSERGQITGGILDGPLALDNAISKESARVKGIVSQVAGDADILVVPDLEAGNMLYKQMSFLFGVDGPGLIMGARVPIILTSRSSGPVARKASSAIALMYARKRDKSRDYA